LIITLSVVAVIIVIINIALKVYLGNKYLDNEVSKMKESSRNLVDNINFISHAINTPDNSYINNEVYKIIQEEMDKAAYKNDIEVFIISQEGNIILQSSNANNYINQNYLDIPLNLKELSNENLFSSNFENRQKFIGFYPLAYPIEYGKKACYVVVRSIKKFAVMKPVSDSIIFNMFQFAMGPGVLIIVFCLLLGRRNKYIENLSDGLIEISKGNLEHRVTEKGPDELVLLAKNVNLMADKLKSKIENEKEIENFKNELVTSVSHDLRTPLTSIIGYLKLVNEKRYENEAQLEKYISIAYKKSENLKIIVDDLFEYVCLSNKANALNLENVCINDLLYQLIEEFQPAFKENDLIIIEDIPDIKIYIIVDGDKIMRVFDNLLSNVLKYSLKPGEVIIKILLKENSVLTTISNRAEEISDTEVDRLFERFYKLDRSREIDGFGIGLAIAKSIIESHEGQIWANYDSGMITFGVVLPYNEI